MHVLAVPNLATSTAFYRDVLGFAIREVACVPLTATAS
jgi:hypothetical protein